MTSTSAGLRFLEGRLHDFEPEQLEKAAEHLLRDRLGRDAAAQLRQIHSVNALLERYVLGPPHVAACLLEATLQGWAMQEEKPKVVPKPEIVSALTRAPKLDPQKDRAWRSSEGDSTEKMRSLGRDQELDRRRIASLAEPVKLHLGDESMGWMLTFGSPELEGRFRFWLIFEWRSKMQYRGCISGIVFVALLMSRWPSGTATRSAYIFTMVSVWFLRGVSVSHDSTGQVWAAVIRSLVAVSASLSQAKDAREANLGSGLLALQAAALHLLMVSTSNTSLFSLQLPTVIVVVLSSFVMVPALCSEAARAGQCPALQDWFVSLALQVVVVLGLPMLWQYSQERTARRLFLQARPQK